MRRCCIRYTQWILRFAGIYTNHSPREKSKTGKKSVRSISRPTCYIYQILPPSSDLSLNHALRCSSRSFSMSPSILSTTMKWNRKLRFSSKESVKTPIKSPHRRRPETDPSSSTRDEKEIGRRFSSESIYTWYYAGSRPTDVSTDPDTTRSCSSTKRPPPLIDRPGDRYFNPLPREDGRASTIVLTFGPDVRAVSDPSLVGSRAPIKITFVPFHAINVRLNDPIFTLARQPFRPFAVSNPKNQ